MLLNISHRTSYEYDSPVQYGLQQLRLTPKSREGQSVLAWEIEIDGGQKELEFDDQNNNRVSLISIDPGNHEVVITCRGEVETKDMAGMVGEQQGFAPLWFFLRSTPLTKPGPRVRSLVKALDADFENDIERLHALSHLISGQISYEVGKTNPDTTAEAAIEAGHGVCQDHAHVFLSAAHLMGYPARYVGGYLKMDDRVDQDAGHAWAEAYVDGIGWVGFDVSNGISPDDRYIRVATGLDYSDAAPISGMRFGDGMESMIVSLQVQQ